MIFKQWTSLNKSKWTNKDVSPSSHEAEESSTQQQNDK